MARPLKCNIRQGSFSARDEALHDLHSPRVTAFIPSARDLQIVDSTLSVVGGDVHNHYYNAERSRDILAILRSIPNFRNVYQDMLSKATLGTGMWLVKAGAGKTLLASIVIEHLETLCQESDIPICVCYVFFRYSERAEVTVRNILEILVKQTLERHPDVLPLVENIYVRHLRENTEPTEAQLLALLRQITDSMAAAFFVLDALDEAPTKIQLAVVKTLASLNVKLFITSRPLKTVESRFPQAHTFTIVAQEADIDLHIAKQIDESADLQYLLQQGGPSLREEIVSTIKQNCGGMFLHASLQLDALCECISADEVSRTLNAFPSKIEDVYLQTWDRIHKQNAHHVLLAKTVLVWVLNASRSMTLDELERAVTTSPETHKFEARRLVPGTTLVSLCRGLIAVEEESQLVRLVHYTAKDTLEELLCGSFPHPHSLLAAVCMTHLTECGFQNTAIGSEDEFRATLEKDPLLAYASETWDFHALAGMDVEDTKRRTAQFVRESHAFPAFTVSDRTQYFDILRPLHMLGFYKLPLVLIEDIIRDDPNIATGVHQESPLVLASWSGHQAFVAQLLALPEIQVNLVTDGQWSSLIAAAHRGHAGVIALLLAHPQIQVNLVTDKGWSALMQAAGEGHAGVVTLLLPRPEIQVNLVTINGWSALMWAASQGHAGVVTLLLTHPKILVNQVSNEGWSAMMLAANNGHEDVIVRFLAHPQIEVDLVNNEGCSALMQAARRGHKGVVKLLLAHPAIQVNLVANDGWSGLMQSAFEGHEGVVTLFLAHPKIQVNLFNKDGWSALVLATRYGHEGTVKLLLGRPEIQINLANLDGWSALLLAAYAGHEGIVELLLASAGIQVNPVRSDGWSALMWAARQGHEGVVRLLLAHPGILVNLVNNEGHSALMWAATNGHEGVVKLLLAHSGTLVNLTSHEGWSALMLAASTGRDIIVKLLLASPGIEANLVNSDRWSPLMAAAREGHKGLVALLLAHRGIQANLVSNHGSTALLLSAERGHAAVVKLLLDVGAFDVNAFDKDRDTSIKMAAKEGHEAVVRMLLDAPNIDISIRSTTDGHTAMSAAQANGHRGITELLRAFESRRANAGNPVEIDQLSLQDNTHEDDDDDDSSEVYHDAEEGMGDDTD